MNCTEPEKVGLSARRLQRVDEVVGGYIDRGQLAGAVTLVARHGQLVHLQGHGVIDLESGSPMDPTTLFRIYSMTKPITSLALLILYEEGHFQLHDPVSKYLPSFRHMKVYGDRDGEGSQLEEPQREITIHDLLTHTSGIGIDALRGSPLAALYRDAGLDDPDQSLADMVAKVAELPLFDQPGTVWRYGVSTDVVAHLVELFSDRSFDAFLAERIFRPLGMQDTSFYVPAEKAHRLATVYGPPRRGQLEPVDRPADSPYTRRRTFLSGSSGLVSTPLDYLRFAQMLLDGGHYLGERIVGRKTVELMTANHLAPELMPYKLPWAHLAHYTRGCGFGLGVRVVMDVPEWGLLGSPGEYGWAGATNTFFWVDPTERLVLGLFAQYLPFMFHPIDRQFKVAVYQALVD